LAQFYVLTNNMGWTLLYEEKKITSLDDLSFKD